MKKYVAIVLFIFWSAVTALLVAGLIFYQNNKSAKITAPASLETASTVAPIIESSGVVPSNVKSSTQVVIPTQDKLKVNEVLLSAATVALHNKETDCWLIIGDKVYSVASYISQHPGSPEAIIPYCGQNVTIAFRDIHSNRAYSILNNFYIGDLNKKIILP